MNPVTLQQAIHTAPFRPFELVLADGSRVAVSHPEWIAFAGGRVALVTDPHDRAHYVDMTYVMKLEVAPPVPTGSVAPPDDDQGDQLGDPDRAEGLKDTQISYRTCEDVKEGYDNSVKSLSGVVANQKSSEIKPGQLMEWFAVWFPGLSRAERAEKAKMYRAVYIERSEARQNMSKEAQLYYRTFADVKEGFDNAVGSLAGVVANLAGGEVKSGPLMEWWTVWFADLSPDERAETARNYRAAHMERLTGAG